MSSNINRCSIAVSKMTLDRFKKENDGRKWKVLARHRSDILNRLAGRANPDGTFRKDGKNFSLANKTLGGLIGLSPRWISELENDLKDLGYLSWTRINKQERREYTIHMDAILACPAEPSAPNPDRNDSNPDRKDSHLNGYPDRKDSNPDRNSCTPPSVLDRQKKEPEGVSPSARPSLVSKTKPTASDREKASCLLTEIKTLAMELTNGAAVFLDSKCERIRGTILRLRLFEDREAVLAAVRMRVQQMDAFGVKNCGSDLAGILDVLTPWQQGQRTQREEELLHVQKAIEAARAEGEKIQKAYYDENLQEQEQASFPADAF